jgi:uncharacterized protein (DUF169 family)
MRSLDILHNHAESLEKLLRLKTFPIAVKLLEKEADIPEGAKRPRRDYGYRLLTCQGFSESRRAGATIAQTKEEMWCFEAAMGYGFIEPVEYFLEGNTLFPQAVSTSERAKIWAHRFPRFEYGKFSAVVSAPLGTVNFEPDVVVIYSGSMQLTQLLVARTWIDGQDITCRISGHGACVFAIVPPMQTGECQVTFPCLGDRRRAWASDDEIIFSVPIKKLEDLIRGLMAIKEYGVGFPLIPSLSQEPLLMPSYMEMAKKTGMHD